MQCELVVCLGVSCLLLVGGKGVQWELVVCLGVSCLLLVGGKGVQWELVVNCLGVFWFLLVDGTVCPEVVNCCGVLWFLTIKFIE